MVLADSVGAGPPGSEEGRNAQTPRFKLSVSKFSWNPLTCKGAPREMGSAFLSDTYWK
jgi:hypothetical protein